MAIPNIISNITVPLLGLIDIAIVGWYGGDVLIGGMALGNIIFSLVYMNFSFLRMGTSGLTAQAYGARNIERVTQNLVRVILVAFIIGVVLLAIQGVIGWGAMKLMDGSEGVRAAALEYYYYRIWGAPAAMMIYGFNGWFTGVQNARSPMWIAIGSNVVNVILSLVLCFGMDMGIEGVGLGTALSQWCGVVFSLLIISRYYGRWRKYFKGVGLFARESLSELFRVNRDIYLRTVCLIAVMVFFTSASSSMGDEILSANNLMMQLFLLYSYLMDGFAYAGEAIVGRFYGAANFTMMRHGARWVTLWAGVTALCFTGVYGVFSESVLGFFNPSAAVLAVAREYIWWAVAVPMAGFLAYLLDGLLVAVSSTSIMRNVMIISAAIFFTTFFLLRPVLGNDALWLAYILFLASRGGFQLLFTYKKLFARQ